MQILKIIGIYFLGSIAWGLTIGIMFYGVWRLIEFVILSLLVGVKAVDKFEAEIRVIPWLRTYIRNLLIIVNGGSLVLFWNWFDSKVPLLFCFFILFGVKSLCYDEYSNWKTILYGYISVILCGIFLYQEGLTTMWFGK